MKLNMYTLRDIVAEDSAPIFCAKNDMTAVRSACHALRQVDNPEEYQLFRVGSFDTDTSEVTSLPPEQIYFVLSPDRKYATMEGLINE